jgi:dipeptide transport system substrate-binding protein
MGFRTFSAGFAVATFALTGAALAQGKTFVYCSEGSPEGFNPSLYTAGTTFDASSRPLFNRLIEFEQGTTKVIPGLAESWTISADGKEYTFKLRKGVKFHENAAFKPSRDFNAEDVLYSFNRQSDPNHPDHKLSGGQYAYFKSKGMAKLLKSLEKVDDYTVKFVLNEPEAPFLTGLGMDFSSIMSAEYADKMRKAGTPDKIDQEPIGTGPFLLVNYQKDSTIRYRAHPNYFRGKAKIDNLVYSITPDAAVRYAKLKAGECHLMPYPNPADIEAMRKDPALKVMDQEGMNVGYLAFNITKKPFDDKRVRQALNYAVNKKAIIDAVFLGTGTAAKNPLPPNVWGYNNNVKDYAYDPAKAKALLAEAGFPNGFETDLWAMPVARPYNPNARRMAEIIQADFEKVGVKAKIVTFEWGEYLKRSRAGEHQTLLLGWTGDNGDPDNFLNELLGCSGVGENNRAQWCNQQFNDLVVKAKRTTDVAERTKLYEQAQVVFKEEAPWVTIAHSLVIKPMRKEVDGFKISPFGHHVFYGVDLK